MHFRWKNYIKINFYHFVFCLILMVGNFNRVLALFPSEFFIYVSLQDEQLRKKQ